MSTDSVTSLPGSDEHSSNDVANKNNLNLSELKQTDMKEKHTAVDYLVAERETLEQEKGRKKDRHEKDGGKNGQMNMRRKACRTHFTKECSN